MLVRASRGLKDSKDLSAQAAHIQLEILVVIKLESLIIFDQHAQNKVLKLMSLDNTRKLVNLNLIYHF